MEQRQQLRCLGLLPSLLFNGIYAVCVLWLSLGANSLSSDGIALLNIKTAIWSDPLELLDDWKDDFSDPCIWKGVGCDSSGRIVSLNITSRDEFRTSHSSQGFCASFLSYSSNIARASEGFPCQVLGENVAYNSSVPCRLEGVLSPAVGNLSELKILSLPFNSFHGGIPKEIANLRSLEVLDLGANQFSGILPAELGQLSQLRILNLAYNFIAGGIPSDLASCRKIQVLNLAGNKLSGNIPAALGSLPDLQVLAASSNRLGGTIPWELTMGCGSLEHFRMEDNFLAGTIPSGFGKCSRLQSLVLSSNLLSGSIPEDLGHLQRLKILDISRNRLGGDIPPQLGNCSQLSLLVLTDYVGTLSSIRNFTGDSKDSIRHYLKDEHNLFSALPATIFSLPRLKILWSPAATLSGSLPSNWGGCQSLEVLNLAGNSLTGNIPAGLAECRQLSFVDLSANKLEGMIPGSLAIECMVVFNVSSNFLVGGLPNWSERSCPMTRLMNPSSKPKVAALLWGDLSFSLSAIEPYFFLLYCGMVARKLPAWFETQGLPIVHDVSRNKLTGPVSSLKLGENLVKRGSSYGLFLSGNQLTGTLPSSFFDICTRVHTFYMDLSNNQFSGALPLDSVANCASLRHFNAASNQFAGKLSAELRKLKHLTYFDLGSNNLSGDLPSQIGDLHGLQHLLLANNCLTGRIPKDIGRLNSLVVLDLSGNKLTGDIPVDLANLTHLKKLLLRSNHLSGVIPFKISKLTLLELMDVACNNLSGPIPQAGNLKVLCTHVRATGYQYLESGSASAPTPSLNHLDRSLPYAAHVVVKRSYHPNTIVIAAITSGCAIAAVLIILLLLFQHTKHDIPVRPEYQSGRKQLVTFRSVGFQLSYDTVVEATGNFSVNNLIGNGGFGATYKAELPGLLVAVKRLSLGRFQGTKQFEAEIRTLGKIQHPNLVTLIGYHASESQMFLIYNYLPGGNLENLLHDGHRGSLSWRIRFKIAIHIAQALAYLHDECNPRVLHRDIKPSNVLLDNNLNAVLSDFGLARLLSASETHATTDVAGTFGYVAPEYAMTCRVSDKADVYSYGVVLLELLSGKKALDTTFSDYGHGFDIVAWACQLWQIGKPKEVFAPGLWEQGPRSELLEVLKLAIKCTMVSLSVRPTMKQVVDVLKSVW